MAAYPLTDLPKAYKIPAQQIDGIDAGLVHATISEAVEKIRRGEGPQFVEAQTVRYPGSETNWPTVPRANGHSAGVGRQQRAGKSPRVVPQLRSVAGLYPRVGRRRIKRSAKKSPPSKAK